MTWFAVALVAIGLADLVGSVLSDDRHPRPATLVTGVSAAAGAVVAVVLHLTGGLVRPRDLLALAITVVGVVVWRVTATGARSEKMAPGLPLGVLGGTLLLLLALSGGASALGGPLAHWLQGVQWPGAHAPSPAKALLVTGLVLVQLSTGNLVVRLVLRSIGALRPSGAEPSQEIRGGRLLGPLERVLILGLGLAGQVTAASLVIAAKGLIRFPELQSSSRADDDGAAPDMRIHALTQYFLVGSFVSWLVALASVGLGR